MIRFLQTPGPTKKIVLGGLLLVICAAMVITLVPGGIGSSIGLGGPGQGVLATVAGEPVTTVEVQREARQMLRQQFPRPGRIAGIQRLPVLVQYKNARHGFGPLRVPFFPFESQGCLGNVIVACRVRSTCLDPQPV